MACHDLILTNFHVILGAANALQIVQGIWFKSDLISTTKKIFAPGKSGTNILLTTSFSRNFEWLPARVYYIDEDLGLALLSISPPLFDAPPYLSFIRDLTEHIKLPFSSKKVEILDEIVVFGCHQQYASSAYPSPGMISHVNRNLNMAGFKMSLARKSKNKFFDMNFKTLMRGI